ncbi:hypothetical protein SAMN04489835_3986 [Mycolicibacterium rutilum]|uniref:Secreted protein n=1 Tax=Mycolicibacterium rutilum TaxID=370526 RepID=A0A1H6KPP6_MYCRU|nr:hypothetical protein [Mycolicibacterium rutilum]SEH77551.1 hypothetical protein SAMN04489835_3986 [Mycolicibacterium rutilum]
MRRQTRLMGLAAAVAVLAPLAPVTAGTAAGQAGGTFVPFNQVLRRCDFSETDFNGPTGYARATAVVHRTGSEVSADIEMNTAIPNIHYDVRLIQMPRPASATCHGGDPGVTAAPIFIDAAGAGRVTLRDAIEPNATGVWVFITRPDRFSQNPAEFYTSDFVAPV